MNRVNSSFSNCDTSLNFLLAVSYALVILSAMLRWRSAYSSSVSGFPLCSIVVNSFGSVKSVLDASSSVMLSSFFDACIWPSRTKSSIALRNPCPLLFIKSSVSALIFGYIIIFCTYSSAILGCDEINVFVKLEYFCCNSSSLTELKFAEISLEVLLMCILFKFSSSNEVLSAVSLCACSCFESCFCLKCSTSSFKEPTVLDERKFFTTSPFVEDKSFCC
ncbi:hypothetical protein AWRI1631_142280 [Saccharomyces cerevisiae AWRI1631]|uniref:Uncharacterized protein n=1 Tax=Saccharomyces cerevisiae (strain AWRI1631) TaxID=545124 RepID=B5VQV2_YEAS6|nr:hypothetical protein AWRI1631_142280 [Saccharomyces cerevisiae AWRI1631]